MRDGQSLRSLSVQFQGSGQKWKRVVFCNGSCPIFWRIVFEVWVEQLTVEFQHFALPHVHVLQELQRKFKLLVTMRPEPQKCVPLLVQEGRGQTCKALSCPFLAALS